MCIQRLRQKEIEKRSESGEMKLGFGGILDREGMEARKRCQFGSGLAQGG